MNAGIISTVTLFLVMHILDPEGSLSVESQIIIGGIVLTLGLWLKSKAKDEEKEKETSESRKASSPVFG